MNNGFIFIHRKLKEHWLWKSDNRLKWWLDVLLTVNYSDNKVLIGNNLIECNRGQSIRSLESWAKEWNVSKKTVSDFFKLLQKDNMIFIENLKITTRITVCKFDSYQTMVNDKETDSKRQGNDKETDSKRERSTNNKDNKENKENKDNKESKPEIFANFDFSFFTEIKSDILDFIEFRKIIKKPIATELELKTFLNKLSKLSRNNLSDAKEIMQNSIAGRWQGIFALKEQSTQQGNQPGAGATLNGIFIPFDKMTARERAQLEQQRIKENIATRIKNNNYGT